MKFFISIILFIFSTFTVHAFDERIVIEETNFSKLALEMKSNKMGLVMMLHAEQCPYCKLMEEEILSPMIRSGEYKNKVFIRKLQVDVSDDVIDFKGNEVSASDLADQYDSRLTPTLLFLDYTGEERAVKIIGINSLEFFGASVDEQIEELLSAIRE